MMHGTMKIKDVPEMSDGPEENPFLQTAGYVITGQLL